MSGATAPARPSPADDGRFVVGYCTNVHAGATLAETKRNLEAHATAVRDRIAPDGVLPIGLWLSAQAARGLAHADDLARFGEWLRERRLSVFTINGFPHGNFHEPIVKHRVYTPDWSRRERLDYTRDLAAIVAALDPPPASSRERCTRDDDACRERSISTLPIGWPGMETPDVDEAQAARHLVGLAADLARLEEERGVLVHVDLEPEPGCVLSTSGDLARFFDACVRPAAREAGVPEDALQRHLRVCHDACHAAVMFEDQGEALGRYEDAGLRVGKVQVSSAVRVDFDRLNADERDAAHRDLEAFAERRYLHQTSIRADDGRVRFFEDLSRALAAVEAGEIEARGEWRTHFHVPIFLREIGPLHTTRDGIDACLDALGRTSLPVRHLEVETYAWGVMPPGARGASLAADVAREIVWLHERIGERRVEVST